MTRKYLTRLIGNQVYSTKLFQELIMYTEVFACVEIVNVLVVLCKCDKLLIKIIQKRHSSEMNTLHCSLNHVSNFQFHFVKILICCCSIKMCFRFFAIHFIWPITFNTSLCHTVHIELIYYITFTYCFEAKCAQLIFDTK